MSDISGAFDHVFSAFLLAKLRALGIPDSLLDFLAAYLAPRNAHVVVGGERSANFTIENSVFQGTVLGPILRNAFFADVVFSARAYGGQESLFADDLSIFHEFDRLENDETILQVLENTRKSVHAWGDRHRVAFDASKEDMCIIHPIWHSDGSFVFLGITFDANLSMANDIAELVKRCRPKIRAIIRARRYYSMHQILNLFKTHIWGMLEYHTSAIYHACDTHIDKIDRLQNSFLDELGLTAKEALLEFNFAPLNSRRDIAMLAVLHRRVLGQMHRDFDKLLPFRSSSDSRKHNKQLIAAPHVNNFQPFNPKLLSERLFWRSTIDLVRARFFR